jgi:hypothetical protein
MVGLVAWHPSENFLPASSHRAHYPKLTTTMVAVSKKPSPPATVNAAAARRWLTTAGVLLLLTWGAWWFASLRQPAPHLLGGSPIGTTERFTTIPSWSLIGLDFQHNYGGVDAWLHGENPYRAMGNDPMNARYIYPPLTLGAFAWTGAFPISKAIPVRLLRPDGEFTFLYSLKAIYAWLVASVAICVLAAWRSWRARDQRKLSPLPLLLIAGATLLSYPVMFELERGNCNVLPLLAIVGVVGLLARPRSWAADFGLAACVVLAAGIKAYPGILILGLVALRHFRAALLAGGLLLALVAGTWSAHASWLGIMRELTADNATSYYEYAHSLAMHWRILWRDLHLAGLAQIPATPAVAAAVLVIVAQVSWRVFKSKTPANHAWPFLLWLTAMGTFVNKLSIDYNLIFVPFALFALWNARDRWWTHLVVLACALWCQPFYLGLSGATLLLLKFLSVAAVGQLICYRIVREEMATGKTTGPSR